MCITVPDVINILSKQKLGKMPGLDNIHMESLMCGGIRLCVHLCFLFNLFARYGYLPDLFMQSVIIPLVKNVC